jgi:hypothetical protein
MKGPDHPAFGASKVSLSFLPHLVGNPIKKEPIYIMLASGKLTICY